MKILVFGSEGYVGSKLVEQLANNKSNKIRGIDALWFGRSDNLEAYDNYELVEKDLFTVTNDDVAGYDVAVFLAGLSNDPMAEFSPSCNFIQNVSVPLFLAYMCKKNGVKKFITASSCSVYGFTDNNELNENSITNCFYPYGLSKIQAELGLLALNSEDFDVIVIRKGTVCGHSKKMRFDLIINTMIKTAMTTGKIIMSNKNIWRPILDIRDAVNVYDMMVHSPKGTNGVFNASSGNYTVGEIASLIKDFIKTSCDKEIEIQDRDIKDFRNYKVSYEKLQNLLGYKPKYDVIATIADVYSHLSDYGDMEQEKYYNIKMFQKVHKN